MGHDEPQLGEGSVNLLEGPRLGVLVLTQSVSGVRGDGDVQLDAGVVDRPHAPVVHHEPLRNGVELDAAGAVVLNQVSEVVASRFRSEQPRVYADERQYLRVVLHRRAGPEVGFPEDVADIGSGPANGPGALLDS